MKHYPVVIIGAGPAGLTAAYELGKHNIETIVLEKLDKVGGIARTEVYNGYHFDIGGHRFYTKVEEVQQLWQEMLGGDLLQVPRLSRIYYQGNFFNYPLSLFNTLSNLGMITSLSVLLSYFKAKIKSLSIQPELETFEDWVTHCFGERLYQIFFKTYTEKVWGIPCHKIEAEWARQRIRGVSLKTAIINALFNSNETKSLIKEFYYPIWGPGMMWERFQQAVENQGSQVNLKAEAIRIERNGQSIKRILVEQDGNLRIISGDHFLSSMPVTALIHRLAPPPPEEVLQAAHSLSYRDFIIVALIINVENLFHDHWIYIHSPEVKVGRIQNFKNWSAKMVPDVSKTCLGMEYFCSEGDEIWGLSDRELIHLATREIGILGLAEFCNIEDATVIRQPKAYPVYDRNYCQHLAVIRKYLETFDNLQTIGRNGMHRYNNQDHSMLTGMLAVKNIVGEKHDLWNVNTERSYYEEFTKEEWKKYSQFSRS